MAAGTLIEIDGSQGEGGGALLRTALVMSAMTQQGLRIENVRFGTRFPGLDIEDLVLIQALAKSARADVIGAEPGSTTATFMPKEKPSSLKMNLESRRVGVERGANCLIVLGSLLPVLARSGFYSDLTIEGETFGFNTLSYDYFANVLLEALKKAGLYAFPDLLRAGFGRTSAGEVRLEVEPSALSGIDWTERGTLREVRGIVSTSGLPKMVADRAIAHLKNLGSSTGTRVETEHIEFPGKSSGIYVTVWARYERGFGGGTAMGARGVKAETLAQSAFDQLLRFMSSDATVDEYLADQLLMPLVFAEGNSTFKVPRLSSRLLTAISVVKQFTPMHLTVRGSEGEPGQISIRR